MNISIYLEKCIGCQGVYIDLAGWDVCRSDPHGLGVFVDDLN